MGIDGTAKNIIRLLDSNNLELRLAAIRVITELKITNPSVIHSLGRALREDSPALKILALKGLVRLGARGVVDMVIPLILEPGELREHALAVIVAVGAEAVEPLQKLYPSADFHGKRAIATALSQMSHPRALQFLLGCLSQETFELQKHLSQCLCDAIDKLAVGAQPPVFKLVKKFLVSSKAKNDLQSQVVGLILLGHFRNPTSVAAARKQLLGFTPKNQPPEVRRYALISLARSISEAPVSNDLINYLEKLLCDDDWHNVAQNALSAFHRLSLPRSRTLKLVGLLKHSPHFSVHIYVLERLSREDNPEVARTIIPFLGDPRYRVREAAEQALHSMPSAMESLFAELAESSDMDLCHRLHNIIRDFPLEVKSKYLNKAISKFIGLYDRNDRRAQFFLEIVRGIDPEPLRRKIYESVESLRRGKSKDRWLKISRYLQILWDHHLITPEGRYLFSISLIRLNSKDLSPHARRANLGLQVLRSLIYDDTPKLVRNLTTSRDLTPDDLYYIGFHFIEEGGELRPFATHLLEHLVKTHPKTKIAGMADQKLRLAEEAASSSAGAVAAGSTAGAGNDSSLKKRGRPKKAPAPAAAAEKPPPPAATPPAPAAGAAAPAKKIAAAKPAAKTAAKPAAKTAPKASSKAAPGKKAASSPPRRPPAPKAKANAKAKAKVKVKKKR
ncbi:MAG: HEAT repeat domain-containing protein [Planctomycetes bacterium]|nr:HEAT repeat domain-containing protein [Planctomycetota bacterium]